MNTHYPIHPGLHVSLGAMQREYIPLFMKGVNDPDVMRGVILQPPVTLEAEYAWYDKMVQKSDIILAILLHERDEAGTTTGYRYIGHTGLHGIIWPEGYAASGTIICDKSCFGKGYGTEAKLLLLYEAFRNRGLRKVCSRVKAFNGNSWGHLLACGYKQVGRFKKHHFRDGEFVDSIEFEVFREDWEPIWDAYQETKSLPRLTDEQRALLQKEIGAL
ncbi:MAG: GNAT family N-acetyltransferase [Candidatus Parcubacteria bacterium]|nr:GNAT family N-acetyltransferase [Candidatus Parcubacteria bacterium]